MKLPHPSGLYFLLVTRHSSLVTAVTAIALTMGGWSCERRMTPVGPTKLRGRIAFHAVYNFLPQLYFIYPDAPNDVRRLAQQTRFNDIKPRWSPDGTQVAFLSNRSEFPDFFRLYMMNEDGSNVTNLFRPSVDPTGDYEFSWAPDGRAIALINQVNGFRTDRYQLFILDVNTLERRRVASAPPNRITPDWSPDGTRIAFVSNFPGSSVGTLHILSYPDLMLQAVDIGLTTPSFPRWSPDGKSLAFIALTPRSPQSYQLYVAETVGFTARQVTFLTGGISNTSVTWSPDGQKLVFSARGARAFDRDLHAINVDGTGFVRLTTDPTDDVAPDWTLHD